MLQTKLHRISPDFQTELDSVSQLIYDRFPDMKMTVDDGFEFLENIMKKSINSLPKSKLLIVEDEVSVFQAMRLFLEEYFDIYHARSISESLSLIEKHSFSIITLDNTLQDGKSELIYEDLSLKAPVIFITADSSTDLAISSLKNGIFDYISKPFEIKDVIRSISQTL